MNVMSFISHRRIRLIVGKVVIVATMLVVAGGIARAG